MSGVATAQLERANQVTDPYAEPTPLAAPRAAPPPSQIPTDKLADKAERWLSASSPAPDSVAQSLSAAVLSGSSHSQAPLPPPPPAPRPYYNAPPPPGHGYSMPQQTQAMMQQHQQYYSQAPPSQSQTSQPYSYAPPPPPQNVQPYPPHPSQAPMSYSQQTPAFAIAQASLPNQQPFPPYASQQYAYGGPPQGYGQAGPSNYPQTSSGSYAPPPAPSHYQQPQHHHSLPPQPQPSSHQQHSRAPPSVSTLQLDQLSLSAPPSVAGMRSSPRPNYYATPEDGPPFKLCVQYPDQKALASMRKTALEGPGGGDMFKKVAWAKQVLKYIERYQSTAGDSSRINDPTLVRWTDEALGYILKSAASPSPVPLALYLRGDLSSSGSFPSYRAKEPKLAFRDFEASANAGYAKAWFRIGRAYEDFGDVRRAVGAYERGVKEGDCGSTYRLAMAYLLGQIGVAQNPGKAVALLQRAADTADIDTPQPPYILGMLLAEEFESPAVQLPKDLVPRNLEEARWRIERSAYLGFGPAQYKMGFSYEYAALGCLFEPLLSVQYYALASQNGEVEADMALSKWYLCGSDNNFEKDESLAFTFAEKAASRQLPSAMFALAYYHEVGINDRQDLDAAKRWYKRAAANGNQDARERLEALAASEDNVLNRDQHEQHIGNKLVRKRTQAEARSNVERERIAASNLAASIGGGGLPPKSSSVGPSGGGGGSVGGGPRTSSIATAGQFRATAQPWQDSEGARVRRSNTRSEVEAAVRMGRANPLAAPTTSTAATGSPRQSPAQGRSSQVGGGGMSAAARATSMAMQQQQQQQQSNAQSPLQEIPLAKPSTTSTNFSPKQPPPKKGECVVM